MTKIRVSKIKDETGRDSIDLGHESVAAIAWNVIADLGGTDIDVLEADDDSAVIEFRGLEGSLDLRDQLVVRGLESTFVGNG